MAHLSAQQVKAFIAGDMPALQALYQATKALVFNVVYKMVQNNEEAEDLVHDIYVLAYEKRQSYNPTGAQLNTWLYRLAVNHTLNVLKRKRWFWDNLHLFHRAEAVTGQAEALDEIEDIVQLQQALAQVDPDFRVCLILKDLEHRAYEEIAEIVGINIGTVRSRLSRGRQQLQKIYKGQVR